ncbi:cell division protein FtsI [Pseudonocardia sp. N23]|nr:cell division protein FtsI [Pseudonocardia sp. N23]
MAAAFVAALAAHDMPAAAALTDDPGPAAADLPRIVDGLGPARLATHVGQSRADSFRYTADWDLGAGRTWTYRVEVPLVRTPDGARVHWSPAVVHPALVPGEALELRGIGAARTRVLDATGLPLMAETTVTVVRLDPAAAATSAPATADALAPLRLDITADGLQDAARRAGTDAVTVVALRDDDYARVADALKAVPGITVSPQSRLLAVPGLDSPVLTPALADATQGARGWQVALVDGQDRFVRQLAGQAPGPADDVALTLDRRRQVAAQRAVATVTAPAALVALQPSTGAVLAVAQNDAADASGPVALSGLYPPGSTFKTVTAVAALQAKAVTVDTVLPCPGSENILGRQIPNDDQFDLGNVPLHTAYAQSCNTTFARVGSGLPRDALPHGAAELGLGSDWDVPGITTVTGTVPEPQSDAEQVEDSIGQGRVVASPFGMALVAATVAAGHVPTPQLIVGRPGVAKSPPPPPLPGDVRDDLATMMRETVTSGSAKRLRTLPGVSGKTGTAQFGDGRSAHGWFIGTTTDDLAFAVLVVGAGSSTPAVGVAAAFLGEPG